MRATFLRFIGFAVCGLTLVFSYAYAKDAVEYKIKAGCLVKFLQFVEWPSASFSQKDSPYIIGILGDDPFSDILDDMVRDRVIDGRKLIARRYKDAKAAREAHIIFIGLKGEALANALTALEGAPALTVGETSSFIESGGMVRFVIRDEKVAFDMSPQAAKKAGLKIGAQLLRLARVVNGNGD
jgi:hypothetical protein